MRISDWSSDVGSSDLRGDDDHPGGASVPDVPAASDQWPGGRGGEGMNAPGAEPISPRTLRPSPSRQPHVRPRSEERRVGKEGVSTCRSWWSQEHSTTKKSQQNTQIHLKPKK